MSKEGGSVVTHVMGGSGGGESPKFSVSEIRVRSGDIIDGIKINTNEFNWDKGGSTKDSFTVGPDRYITEIQYATRTFGGHEVLSGLKFYLSDGTIEPGEYAQYGADKVNKSLVQDITGFGPTDPNNSGVLVMAIGVNHGDYIDALDVVAVKDFANSQPVKPGVTAIFLAVPPGVEQDYYVEVDAKEAFTYEQSTEQKNSVSVNASVQGTYFVTASVSSSYSYEYSEKESIGEQIEKSLKKSETTKLTCGDKYEVLYLATDGDIFLTGGDTDPRGVFVPTPKAGVTKVQINEDTIQNIDGFYDLADYSANLKTGTFRRELDNQTGMYYLVTKDLGTN